MPRSRNIEIPKSEKRKVLSTTTKHDRNETPRDGGRDREKS
jgi:hypothetical protein